MLVACSTSTSHTGERYITDPPSKSQIKTSVKDQVTMTLNAFTPVAGQALLNNTVLSTYAARSYQPIWIKDKQIDPSIYQLVKILEQANSHGLNPIHYHANTIKRYLALKSPTSQQLAEMDVITTIALSNYAHDISNGRYEPQLIDPNWQLDAPSRDWKDLLSLRSARNMVNALPLLTPRNPQYQILQKWLVYYQLQAKKEKDIYVTPGKVLSLGGQGPRVAQLRERLIQLGDIRFSTHKIDKSRFDRTLKTALRGFQHRHNIIADGSAGEKTLAMLNVPLQQRAKEIAFNLERWRWLPNKLEANRIWVDLTNYSVDTYLNGSRTTMRTVIGKEDRMTPVFKGMMTYMVANPSWRIPQRIAREHLLPKLQTDPNYLKKHGFRVFSSWSISAKELDATRIDWKKIPPDTLSFRFEQIPDERNSLGEFKFMFPNKNDIYLHDTPAKYLFTKTNRAYSSGCIRLEKAEEFAKTIMSGTPQTNTLVQAIKSKKTTVITLPTYIPVYIVYFTVAPNANGMLEFRNDIYHRDTLMEQAMGYKPFLSSEPL